MIGLQNYQNIDAPDSDYPDGQIRDNPGDQSGTPYDKRTYADIHQLMAKLAREAAVTPNDLFDNDYNGYQLFDSLVKALSGCQAWIANVTQASTGAPTTTSVILNSLNGISGLSWSRIGVGTYRGLFVGGNPLTSKTRIDGGGIIIGGGNAATGYYRVVQFSSNQISLFTWDLTGALTDGILSTSSASIKIEVFY